MELPRQTNILPKDAQKKNESSSDGIVPDKYTLKNSLKGKGKTAIRNSRNVAKKLGFGLIILVCLYLVLMPFLPLIPYFIREMMGENVYVPLQTLIDGTGRTVEEREQSEESIPSENTVVIPAVGIEVNIIEGSTDSALDHGAWRRPGTGDPENGGNMVVTGHRFKYLPPSNLTFYNLDKVVVGDYIIVYWNGKRYDYQVDRIRVVTPDTIEVESSTDKPQLTLYTCTPLWTAKMRLVIVALPVEQVDLDRGEDSADDNLEE